MNEPTVSVLPMVALRAPRKFSCHALPEGAFAPPEGEAAERLGAAVGAALGLRALTPVARQVAPDVWLCAFLHGEARRRWVATYERGRPGRKKRRPGRRCAGKLRKARFFRFSP